MATRVAIGLACLGVMFSITGTASAARIFVSNAGRLTPVFAWCILPLSVAVLALVQIMRQGAPWVVWTMVGSLWGFVVAAMWSLGTFYASGALVLFLAAIVDLIGRAAPRRAAFAVIWLVAGFTALGPMFITIDWIRRLTPGVTVDHAPAIIWASWVFVGTMVTLALASAIESRRFRGFVSSWLR